MDDIFENGAFFRPLCCKNRKFYYGCIKTLIDYSYNVTELYEKDARGCLSLYIRNSKIDAEDESDTDSGSIFLSDGNASENASSIMRYFRRCGWLSERSTGRTGDLVTMVTPECRKLVFALDQAFFREESAVNNIFAIRDIIRAAFEENNPRMISPYASILLPIRNNVAFLKEYLHSLKTSIESIMCAVLRISEMEELSSYMTENNIKLEQEVIAFNITNK